QKTAARHLMRRPEKCQLHKIPRFLFLLSFIVIFLIFYHFFILFPIQKEQKMLHIGDCVPT
ncbi:MAG: hypothetical protein PUE72_13105, partial [Lachnospiraceae bacterium]|nr:hypothetical protein [Lachnospiraceae bacterium]